MHGYIHRSVTSLMNNYNTYVWLGFYLQLQRYTSMGKKAVKGHMLFRRVSMFQLKTHIGFGT